MRLEERLKEILQASSGHYKVGLNQLKVDFDKLDDGTIKEGSINFEVTHYPRIKIENPSKPGGCALQNENAIKDLIATIESAPQFIIDMDKDQRNDFPFPI